MLLIGEPSIFVVLPTLYSSCSIILASLKGIIYIIQPDEALSIIGFLKEHFVLIPSISPTSIERKVFPFHLFDYEMLKFDSRGYV